MPPWPAQCPQDHQRSLRLSSPAPPHFTSAKKPPRLPAHPSLAPTRPKLLLRCPQVQGFPSVTRTVGSGAGPPGPAGDACRPREPRMVADPYRSTESSGDRGGARQRWPSRGDGLLLPTGLRLWTARPRMARSLISRQGRHLEIQSLQSFPRFDSGLRSCENS